MADDAKDNLPANLSSHFIDAMLASLGASQTEAGSPDATDSEDRELPQHICFVCGESKTKDGKALLNCGNCGFARYCSKECQKKAWKKHKTFCNFTKQGNELKEKDKEVLTSAEENADQKSKQDDPALVEIKKLMDNPALQASENYIEQATGMPSLLTLMRIMEQQLREKKK